MLLHISLERYIEYFYDHRSDPKFFRYGRQVGSRTQEEIIQLYQGITFNVDYFSAISWWLMWSVGS